MELQLGPTRTNEFGEARLVRESKWRGTERNVGEVEVKGHSEHILDSSRPVSYGFGEEEFDGFRPWASEIAGYASLRANSYLVLGKRLAESDHTFDSVTMSTMCRATETANIMMEQMKPLPYKSDSILEEGLSSLSASHKGLVSLGAPYPTEPPVSHWRPKASVRFCLLKRLARCLEICNWWTADRSCV